MKARTLLTLLAFSTTASLWAQAPQWNKEKYPDYNPTPHVDMAAHRAMKQRMAARREQGLTRPDHWNNALLDAFPPVMNQSAGSCGSASRIYYMFSEEINAARGASGKLAENIYPTHFTWLLTWSSNQGKEVIAQHNGIPNSEVYGGTTYSERFGYQDCDDQNGYDYGWMQGYDKWYHAMHNRIVGSSNFAYALNTEEGREMVKNYLWNHCGDDSYSAGGIVGVGVSSGGDWRNIPQTSTNDELGVTNKYYVQHWGNSIDHALTIVGYDDRIEFDLDGNGIAGEADKDEVGAWIIVNSWGRSWNNEGFIYCPYAEARPTATTTDYWTPEYYTIRRDYHPKRTLKVKMDYSHRSEIALYVGYATNLSATKPEKETWLRHFYYAGLSKGFTASASKPDPAIPMLGRWSDGQLHTEPMEFGYDLTDLVAGIDPSTPLKFFFRVETRSWAKGSGHIYYASIVDYSVDPKGIETPFEVAEGGEPIQNKGKKTTIQTTARAELLPAPRNLTLNGNTLNWQAPAGTPFLVQAYRIYLNGSLLATVNGNTLTSDVRQVGNYTVCAVYDINGNECESEKPMGVMRSEADPATNTYLQMAEGAKITVPHFNQDNINKFTIEFWLKPQTLSTTQDNFGMRSSSGKFFFKINKDKKVEVGFDGGDYAKSDNTVATDTWQHIAVTANNNNLTVLVNDMQFISFTTGWGNTVGSMGNLIIGQTEGTTTDYKNIYAAPWTGAIDELRIWNTARTTTQVKATAKESFIYPALADNIAYYYKMDTRQENGTTYLVDAIGDNDATISGAEQVTATQEASEADKVPFVATASTDFVLPTSTTAGRAVSIQSNCAPGTTEWSWTFTGADISTATTIAPVVVFKETGEQTVKLVTKNINGETTEKEKTITVNTVEAPKASFKVNASEISVGNHVSFVNTSTPLEDCTYEWTLEGSDCETAHTVNAAATYLSTGTYTVRLTATNAAGSDTAEQQIDVVKIAPDAAFTIHNNVAIAGENVTLIDESRYEPDAWTWTISSTVHTYMVNGQNGTIKMDDPGVYAVTLEATNEKGSSTTTVNRAITICAHDGENGLKFDAIDDEVVAASPFGNESLSAFTIGFWLYPGTLSESCIGIGDSESTFFMHTDLDGSITVCADGKSVSSYPSVVIANEWHHYAVTFNEGKVAFFRDGTPYGGVMPLEGVTTVPAWTRLRLGGSEAPLNAIIDEFRVWNRALSYDQMKEVCNAPISDPGANTSLKLYYDFNQSTGNVIDKSASQCTGQRNNFGPDGDAWTSSKGIFYLNFDQDEDVTGKYLKNYKAPFLAASDFVNGTSRFKRLQTGTDQSPWIQENSVVSGTVSTEFHVDENRGDYLTLNTKQDGFAAEVNNLKLYQTIHLPAGVYTFYAQRGDYEWFPSQTKTVFYEGEGLPDWADTEAKALCSTYCGLAKQFIITEPKTLNVGLVSVQKGQTCNAIKEFVLLASRFTMYDANGEVVAINDTKSQTSVNSDLQAEGGLNSIIITAHQPQFVNIFSLSGQLVWASFVDSRSTVRVPSGIYLVAGKKIIVR